MKTCTADGRPDPNGEFEIIPRRKIMKDGERLGFGVFLVDSGPATEDDVASAYHQMVADMTGATPAPALPTGRNARDYGRALVASDQARADAYAEMVADLTKER